MLLWVYSVGWGTELRIYGVWDFGLVFGVTLVCRGSGWGLGGTRVWGG